MSDSVQPRRWQPNRLPCPWDFPGKNTGVGCHFLLQCMKVKSESEVAQLCPTPSDPMDCSPPGSSIHVIFQARVLEWGAIAFSEPCIGKLKMQRTADRLLDYTLATDKIEFDLNMGCRDIQVEKPWWDLKLICTLCSCCCNGYFKNGDTLTLYYSDFILCSF